MALEALAAEREGAYHQAIDVALRSLPHIDGATQFERKFMKMENPPLPTLGIVFRYAPPLFRQDALDRVDVFLAERRGVEKRSGQDLKAQLAEARQLLDTAYRLWQQVRGGTPILESREPLKSDRVYAIEQVWERSGLIERIPPGSPKKWAFRTQFNAPVRAKCNRCGHPRTAPKVAFLEESRCPKCGGMAAFVILGPASKVTP